MAKAIKKPKVNVAKDLATRLAGAINKASNTEIALDLTTHETPLELSQWVSTGNRLLDYAISNRRDGGLPTGRIIGLEGLEGSGKSLILAHIMKHVQQIGGIAVYFDTESALNRQYMETIGVDLEKLVYVQTNELEQIFEFMHNLTMEIREQDKDIPIVMGIDSLTSAITQDEVEAGFEKQGYATSKAITNSRAFPKLVTLLNRQKIMAVMTAQLRQNLNAGMFGDKWISSTGGKAFDFYASSKIRLSKLKKITMDMNGQKIEIGSRTKAKVIKNRFAMPNREAEFDIIYTSGIDDVLSWMDYLVKVKVIKSKGAYRTYKYNDEQLQFYRKDFKKILAENEGLEEELNQITEKLLVIKYDDEIDMDAVKYDDAHSEDVAKPKTEEK